MTFFNFRPFFGLFLGTVVKNETILPGISLNFWKKKMPSVDIQVPKMCFSKMYIFGAPIESTAPGMVSS